VWFLDTKVVCVRCCNPYEVNEKQLTGNKVGTTHRVNERSERIRRMRDSLDEAAFFTRRCRHMLFKCTSLTETKLCPVTACKKIALYAQHDRSEKNCAFWCWLSIMLLTRKIIRVYLDSWASCSDMHQLLRMMVWMVIQFPWLASYVWTQRKNLVVWCSWEKLQ